MTEKTLFDLARNSSGDELAALLDRECAGDPTLRDHVEGLLVAYERLEAARHTGRGPATTAAAGADVPGDAKATPDPDEVPPSSTPGTALGEGVGALLAGKYKLVEEIGEGGMGTVFLARQTAPVKRAVAVKVIKAGMDTRAVLARFDAERQALALMDHPNIARVLDAGTTDSGRPFFVMDLVKGVPITTFCDASRLTPRQRLELFVPVCQAIQHAHQKGIIHRDIKPSNVLVALYDDHPVPKVIDFGVAKATGTQLTEHTLVTGFGAVLGTPEYMSPEQASFNNLDIDTRSDVYALGVLLYELLTGTTPVDRKSLGRAAVLEVLRIVREVETPRPSTRLSTLDALPSIAACRGVEPARLAGLIRGELDWIAIKALEKDRSRRYETANALARDVQRYLADEVVEARPPSAGYRMRKFMRRHRGRVVAAGLVLLALVAGIIGTSWGLVRARAANARAQKRLEQIEKGNEILTGIFADLDINEVKQADRLLEAVLAERLVKAAGQFEGESVGDPLAVAALQDRLGRSLLSLGFAAEAIPPLEKARATRRAGLGPDHPSTLESLSNLASAYQVAGRLGDALPLAEEHLRLARASFGPDHSHTIESLNDLAWAYRTAGRLDRAVPLLEEAVRRARANLGPDHRLTLSCVNNLAMCYKGAGRRDDALPLFEKAHRLAKTVFGPDHPNTITALNNLASVYMDAGRLTDALALDEEAYRLAKARLGPTHPTTLVSSAHLAYCYQLAGRLDEALPLLEEQYRAAKVKLGPDHRHTLIYMSNLASGTAEAGRLDEALHLLEEALRLAQSKLGPDHPDTLIIMYKLAEFYRNARRPDRSVPLLQEVLKLRQGRLDRTHPETLRALAELGVNDKDAGRLKDALPRLEEAYRARRTIANFHRFGVELLDGYARAGRSAEAAALALELLAEARQTQTDGRWQPLADALDKTGELRLRAGEVAEAEPLLREALAIRTKAQPDTWTTSSTRSMLGGALLGQKKYAEAEPLLRQGYEGMKAREMTIPPISRPRLADSLDRLIELYTTTDKPDEVKKWRTERARYDKDAGSKPGEKK